MTYEEAEEKALKVQWKIGTCGVGEECWCRIILPEETIHINHSDGITEYDSVYSVVDSGAVSKEVAERIVEDHNLVILQSKFAKRINGGTYIPLSERIKQQDNDNTTMA